MQNVENQAFQPQYEKKKNKIKKVIIILTFLLVLSVGALAANYIYVHFFASNNATSTVPDNLIGEKDDNQSSSNSEANGNFCSDTNRNVSVSETEAVNIELFQGKNSDNERFQVSTMMPGDNVTKYFCVKINHDADVHVFFTPEIKQQTKKLANVLNIRVTNMESGKVLFDLPFFEIDRKDFLEKINKNSQNETVLYYKIDAYISADIGNEYQGAKLVADFNWRVDQDDALVPSPDMGDNALDLIWIVFFMSSAGLLVALLVRRKEEKRNEQS